MNHKMRSIVPGDIPTRELHQFLLGCISPRPIAFVSTKDKEGHLNLAPYSFFNIFSSNPPTAVFSSNRRVLNNTTKDTLKNVQETGEAVINVVSYDMVRQMAVSSVEFPEDVSEFEQANFTPIASDIVSAPRVLESPAQLECTVKDIITLGEHGGAGHLIICNIVKIHISEHVIDDRNRIDPHKIDLMGRMGRAYYCRASGDAIHTIVQAVTEMVIGYPALPQDIKQSHILTANEVGRLSGIHSIPSQEEIMDILKIDENLIEELEEGMSRDDIHKLISAYLDQDKLKVAAALAFYQN